jgi:general secretion pathway protein I
MKPVRAANARGFTLVEVLVALAITALALAAGSKAAGALIDSTERQQNVLVAQLCAENELVRVRLSRQFPVTGDSRFACRQGGLTLEGVLTVVPTPNPNFRRLDAKVHESPAQPSDDIAVISQGYRLARISTVLGRY